MLTRRRLLEVSLVTAGALGAGSALLMRGGGDEHYRSLVPPGAAPRVLSEKELAVLRVFCDRVIAARAPSAVEARVAERIDRELQFHTARMKSDLKAALLLVEHGGPLHGRTTRFTRLTAAEQDAHLTRMALGLSVERQAFAGLRLMAIFFYYCDERTWPGIHYAGPMATRKRPPADSDPFAES